jgi:hypothetical protein
MISFEKQTHSRKKNYLSLNNQSNNVYNVNQNVSQGIRFKTKKLFKIPSDTNLVAIKEESTIYKNHVFNWVHYLLLNQDLIDANVLTCEEALTHWSHHGIEEDRKAIINDEDLNQYLYLYTYLKNIITDNFIDSKFDKIISNKYTIQEQEQFNRFPHLFHKYLLYLRDPNDKMTYKISKYVNIDKKLICSIHCYDLNLLFEYFNEFFDELRKYFSIVVTYCVENMDVIGFYDFTFIYIKNMGMDIGNKFVTANFLKSFNIDYNYVFFLHSKSDLEKRRKYIMPFINNISNLNKLLLKNSNVGAVFPNIFLYGKNNISNVFLCENLNLLNFGLNANVVDELLVYYNLPQNLLFTEGNFYVLHKDVINEIFIDLKIYNVLNDANSFDFNWVKGFYFLHGSYLDVYKHFKKHNLFGNTNYYNMTSEEKLMVRDYMIEHAFERIIISALLKKKRTIHCANFNNSRLNSLLKMYINYLNNCSKSGTYNYSDAMIFLNNNLAGAFKCEEYLTLNKDLVPHLHSRESIVTHWLNHGIQENREFSLKATDDEYYKFLNSKYHINMFNLNTNYYSTHNYNQFHASCVQFKNYNMEHLCNNFEKRDMNWLFHYNNLILIIDFPILGGGTTIFLDTIVSKYKTSQSFLICRKFNGNIYFCVNDEFIIGDGVDENQAIQILQAWIFKISKIFINSIVGHSKYFLDFITKMNKPITAITHDHSLIHTDPQMYYHNIYYEDFPDSCFDINKLTCLVTQNEKNLSIFGKYLHDVNKVVISDLPDYKRSLSKINTENSDIVIGVNGNISYIKGYLTLKKIIEKVSHWANVKLVIFGHCLDPGYPHQYTYNNIDEFNNLISIHKPNFWIETSIWPETYSYTLTQMMLTQLPILYQKKNFPSVIESRLSQYSKAYSFDNVDLITYEVLQSLKQNYFYTIEPAIHYGKFWDDYFENGAMVESQSPEKNVVFISSKIHTSSNEFTYSATRSIYSPTERFHQTLNTISSIRVSIPNSYIILFDNSEFSLDELNKLNSVLDLFLNVQTDPIINDYTNVKTTKAYGELAQTYAALKYIQTNANYLKIKQFFKISGRYFINETFNYSQYNNDFNVFKRNATVVDRQYYYTSFYKISGLKFEKYCETIDKIYNYSKISDDYYNLDWEVILAKQLNYNFIEISNLGITQNISVWNQTDQV